MNASHHTKPLAAMPPRRLPCPPHAPPPHPWIASRPTSLRCGTLTRASCSTRWRATPRTCSSAGYARQGAGRAGGGAGARAAFPAGWGCLAIDHRLIAPARSHVHMHVMVWMLTCPPRRSRPLCRANAADCRLPTADCRLPAQISEDAGVAVSGDSEGVVLVWDLEAGACVMRLQVRYDAAAMPYISAVHGGTVQYTISHRQQGSAGGAPLPSAATQSGNPAARQHALVQHLHQTLLPFLPSSHPSKFLLSPPPLSHTTHTLHAAHLPVVCCRPSSLPPPTGHSTPCTSLLPVVVRPRCRPPPWPGALLPRRLLRPQRRRNARADRGLGGPRLPVVP